MAEQTPELDVSQARPCTCSRGGGAPETIGLPGHHTYYGFERRWDSSGGGGPADSLDRLERTLRRLHGSTERAREHDEPNPLIRLAVRCCCGWTSELVKAKARSAAAVTDLLGSTLAHVQGEPIDLLELCGFPLGPQGGGDPS